LTDPLIGKIIDWPGEFNALRVLDVEHEYDDGTACLYLTGPNAGSQTMRDTFRVRRLAAEQSSSAEAGGSFDR
jgi:hypothetical protein